MGVNNPGAKDIPYIEGMKPADVLQRFVGIITDKGCLNQTIRIKLRDRKYSILCSEKTFIAYRINDYWGVPPGIPGWPVCIVDREQIVEDSGPAARHMAEPGAYDWLCCITNSDFETI